MSSRFILIGPGNELGPFETYDEAEQAAAAQYEPGAPLEWRNPESGRHTLWYRHADEGLLVDTGYRIIER
ncbi:hypothetical protein [Kitasatospora indigofera]|uniref:hypothetical protein n=1 Tax=Kitasatospora indigofera TaxID=67307 RepID=UPI0036B2503A